MLRSHPNLKEDAGALTATIVAALQARQPATDAFHNISSSPDSRSILLQRFCLSADGTVHYKKATIAEVWKCRIAPYTGVSMSKEEAISGSFPSFLFAPDNCSPEELRKRRNVILSEAVTVMIQDMDTIKGLSISLVAAVALYQGVRSISNFRVDGEIAEFDVVYSRLRMCACDCLEESKFADVKICAGATAIAIVTKAVF
jgi:hypothetical protein